MNISHMLHLFALHATSPEHQELFQLLSKYPQLVELSQYQLPLLQLSPSRRSFRSFDEKRPHVEFVFLRYEEIVNSLRIVLASQQKVYIDPFGLLEILPTPVLYGLLDDALDHNESEQFQFLCSILRNRK